VQNARLIATEQGKSDLESAENYWEGFHVAPLLRPAA
jgi:hypothetical protein